MLVAESSRGTVCAVHVEPEAITLANFGECVQVVNGAGICGADGSDNGKRFKSGGEVLLDVFFKSGWVELHARIHCDPAQRFAADAEQSGGLVERVMAFRRRVKHWPIA